MYKLLRIALFTAPLVGGVAWAQGSGTSGSAPAPGSPSQSVTDDTRTPLQQKAARIDDTTPALPGDATKPVDVPNTVRDSDATGMTTPGSQSTDKKMHKRSGAVDKKSDESTTTTKIESKSSNKDLQRDQLDSDK